VDGDDLTYWEDGTGLATGAEKGDGDANNDGIVDGADFLAWQRQVGSVAPIAAATGQVPEPSAFALMACTALCMLAWQRRRREK
jgi:hypothetical protein